MARDFNGDGRDDLAVANAGPAASSADDDVTILLGTPTGLVHAETLTVRGHSQRDRRRCRRRGRSGARSCSRTGFGLTVAPDEPASLAFELVGSARTVRLARVGDVVLAQRRLRLTAAQRRVTLKLAQRFRSRLSRRFSLTIRVTGTDAAGNRTVTTRKLRVR